MPKNKIITLEDAKKELHSVSQEIKSLQKKFNIPKRTRDISKLKHIMRHFGNRFDVRNVKLSNGKYRESTESRMFHLLKNKYWLEGFISANLKLSDNSQTLANANPTENLILEL